MVAIRAAGAIGERHVPELAGARAGRVAGPRAPDLHLGEPDTPPHDPGVGAQHAIVVVAVDPVGVREPHGRRRSQVAPQAHEVVHGVGAGGGFILVVHGAEVGDAGAADLARELGAEHRVHDPPGVDQAVRRVELLEALEEERPFLGIEQREPLVDGHLADVRLHLGEVGVRGGRDGEVLRHPPAQVAAEFRGAGVVIPPGARRAIDFRRELGSEVEHDAALQPREADEAARLDEETGVGAHRRGPRLLVPRVLHDAHDLEAPVLRVGALVAEALQGNSHLDFVTPIGQAAAGLVDVIRIQIDRRVEPPAGARSPGRAGADPVAPDAILLDPQGIDGEQRGAAVVEIGVEQDLDAVIRIDVVAVGERRANDLAVRLERPDAEIHRLRRVPHEDLGRVLGGAAVYGTVLGEAGERRGLTPHTLVEDPVNGDLGFDPRDVDVELPGTPVVDGAVTRLEDEEEGEHGMKNRTRNAECGTRNRPVRIQARTYESSVRSSVPRSAFRLPRSIRNAAR